MQALGKDVAHSCILEFVAALCSDRFDDEGNDARVNRSAQRILCATNQFARCAMLSDNMLTAWSQYLIDFELHACHYDRAEPGPMQLGIWMGNSMIQSMMQYPNVLRGNRDFWPMLTVVRP
jgi:hypothetical protein